MVDCGLFYDRLKIGFYPVTEGLIFPCLVASVFFLLWFNSLACFRMPKRYRIVFVGLSKIKVRCFYRLIEDGVCRCNLFYLLGVISPDATFLERDQ